jgi:hypothetical protein
MNPLGARKFGEWLGHKVGEAVQTGILTDPTR